MIELIAERQWKRTILTAISELILQMVNNSMIWPDLLI